MYKIDICLHYMQCAKLWVCVNHTKPNRPWDPHSKAQPLLETTLETDPCPPGCHDVSSVHRGQHKPCCGYRAETGSECLAQLPHSVRVPGQGCREFARVIQHLWAEPHLELLPQPQYRISLYCSSASALKSPSAASSYYCLQLLKKIKTTGYSRSITARSKHPFLHPYLQTCG